MLRCGDQKLWRLREDIDFLELGTFTQTVLRICFLRFHVLYSVTLLLDTRVTFECAGTMGTA